MTEQEELEAIRRDSAAQHESNHECQTLAANGQRPMEKDRWQKEDLRQATVGFGFHLRP
jgi:hypothetical protein